MIDNLFPCDISAFVTIQEAIMRLTTIGLISTLVLGLLVASLPTEAQQAGKVYRIDYLSVPGPDREKSRNDGWIWGAGVSYIFPTATAAAPV